jgi:hypothetical protein
MWFYFMNTKQLLACSYLILYNLDHDYSDADFSYVCRLSLFGKLRSKPG